MAQKMLDLKKKMINTSTQTGFDYEFSTCISQNKRVNFYYCNIYKEYVISFNYGDCKKFILNKSEWNKFRVHFEIIDKIHGNYAARNDE
jgi:hypothetical protein